MSVAEPYLLLMHPAILERPWGGSLIRDVLGKTVPAGLHGRPLGESWEVSTHPHGVTTIANGPLAGASLAEVFRLWGERLVGSAVSRRYGGVFPLLVKIIEANALASVQVHPNDEQAMRLEGEANGKAEAWYILSAGSTAEAYIGFKAGVDAASFRRAVERGAVRETLEPAYLWPGDCVLLEPGTVHACGNGILLLEVQQSSDLTYRVFDWDRVDARGARRELHLDKALEVIDFAARPRVTRARGRPDSLAPLASTRQFRMDEIDLVHEHVLERGSAFRSLTVIAGRCVVTADEATRAIDPDGLTLSNGQTVLLPAGLGATLRGAGRLVMATPAF